MASLSALRRERALADGARQRRLGLAFMTRFAASVLEVAFACVAILRRLMVWMQGFSVAKQRT